LSKTKFRYNPESLNYEEVELGWQGYIRKFSYFIISAIVFTTIVVALLYPYIKNQGIKEAKMDVDSTKEELISFMRELEEIELILGESQSRDDNIYRAIFEADPYPQHKRGLGTGGNPMKYDKYKNIAHSELVIDIAKKIEKIEKKLVAQSRSYDEVIELIKTKGEILHSIPSIQPINNADLTRLASGFGMRMHPIYKIMKLHAGMDFTAKSGTEIYASGDGIVEKANWMSGYGQIVIIDHGFGYKTRYAHCSKYNVKKGQRVKRGDVIAFVGNTGASVGAHLHYEVRKNGKAINPVNYFFNDLSPEEYEKVIELSSKPTQSME